MLRLLNNSRTEELWNVQRFQFLLDTAQRCLPWRLHRWWNSTFEVSDKKSEITVIAAASTKVNWHEEIRFYVSEYCRLSDCVHCV